METSNTVSSVLRHQIRVRHPCYSKKFFVRSTSERLTGECRASFARETHSHMTMEQTSSSHCLCKEFVFANKSFCWNEVPVRESHDMNTRQDQHIWRHCLCKVNARIVFAIATHTVIWLCVSQAKDAQHSVARDMQYTLSLQWHVQESWS